MEKFELEAPLSEEIRARTLGDGFMKLVQTVRRGGRTFRIALRPVSIGGEKRFQAEMTDDGQVRVKNLDANGAAEGLEEIISQKGARDLHLMTATGDLHVRVTKKGRVLTSRSAEMARPAEVLPHDRVKKTPLASFDSTALLQVVGIADADGRIRASMRGKYDQVNEFLRIVGDALADEKERSRPFTVVDCGCGKSYLTFALYFHLTQGMGFGDVRVVGVDRRADVIAASRKAAAALDVADRVVFIEADLGDPAAFKGGKGIEGLDGRADMVVSLHACDTATDEALARGIEWKARYILSAPCCQHELQKAVGRTGAQAERCFAGLLRHGILRERLCDLLTDSFRALLLRILGYRVQVVEFVSPDATARNILLRAEYGVKAGQPQPVAEYLDLRDGWGVTPWLETRLADRLAPILSRFER
ncbi:MAG: SAM-dependent methyltransferase [Kiritimatiellae bacterium]|nr:SAM-dependent methyltransferase [Kiritimatiellia bacterium]